MRLKVLFQYIALNFKLPKKMTEYSIYWQPQLTANFASQCPFLNLNNPDFFPPIAEWANGYCVKEFMLTEVQYNAVFQAAVDRTCIDVRPSPRPAGSPHGK